ncbi:MAG: hypothetical protein VKO21_03685 [Candidatus Sericytochromatia bacterium]|nr:hypothetical protein [Candidatus Sericytochromatia bacterium]
MSLTPPRSHLPWWLIGLVLLAGLPAVGKPQPNHPMRQLAEARLLAVAEGDLPGAISRLEVLIPEATGQVLADAAADLGDHYAVLGQEEAARAAYRTALNERSAHLRAATGWVRTGGLGTSEDFGGDLRGLSPTRPGQGWEALLPEEDRIAFRTQVDLFARQEAARRLNAAGRRLLKAGQARRATSVQLALVVAFGETMPPGTMAELVLELGTRCTADEGLQAFRALEARTPGLGGLPATTRAKLWKQQGQRLWELGRSDAATQLLQQALADAELSAGTLRLDLESLARSMAGGLSAETWRRAARRLTLLESRLDGKDRQEAAIALRELAREHPRSNLDGRALTGAASVLEDGERLLEDILTDDRRNDLWPDGTRAGGRALALLARRREARGDVAGARQAWQQLLEFFPDGRDASGNPLKVLAQKGLGTAGLP